MTDFNDSEISLSSGSPFELYEFTGSYKTYRMTSDSLPHTFLGSLYPTMPGLKRGAVKIATHDQDGGSLNIQIPITEQIVKDYGFADTPPNLQITIYRLHRNASAWVVYWKGFINSFSVDGEFANLKSPSGFSNILQSNIPSVYIQPPCNNVLFDSRCKVNRSTYSLDTTVTVVAGSIITVAAVPAFSLVGGELAIVSKNERRTIIAQASNALTVNFPFAKISASTPVQVTAGCDHSFSGSNGCAKFSNKPNFGGFPFVPGEGNNPFTTGIQ